MKEKKYKANLPTIQFCPICGTATRYSNRIYKCNNCGHGYRKYDGDPVEFHSNEFRKLYQREENEIVDGEITECFHTNREKIVHKRVALISKFLRKSDAMLDVGGGAGTFALASRSLVKSISVIEVSQMLVDHCVLKGLPARKLQLGDIPDDESYDVVCAWHVLEHLDPIQRAAQKLKRIFRRFLIIEVPKERGAPERFDGHFHFFSDQSLQLLFSDLVIRQYGNGVQMPARLAVFEKTRSVARIHKQVLEANASLTTGPRPNTDLPRE